MELHIHDVSKTYPNGVQALKDVTLTIPAGMYGLLGRNGAGKKTLMRILATLQEPDDGSIRLGDIDVVRQKERVRETLGYLPQSFGFHPRVNAERLLDHFAVLKGVVERGARRDVVESLLRRTNPWGVRKQRIGTFSGGMRQRLGVAVALVGNPKLIVVDEPTAGLDPEERVRFLNLLSEIGEASVVILSTHIVEDVEELCNRLAIIDRGAILLEAEPMRAIADLRGRIWRQTVSRDDLAALEEALPVISTKLMAGRTIAHVEIPPYSINGRALATTIAFAEQHFITRVREGGGDMTFFGTAHEVAHSWWGGQLRRAEVRGATVLSESLSNYSAMMVTEKILGQDEARRVYDFQMDRYLSRRSAFETDVPLVEVEDHSHIAYGKGTVAMYTLLELIGEEPVNTALRHLLGRHRDGSPPYPTALDLVRELRAVTPDSLQYLLTDLFETVTLWDVKTVQAVSRPSGEGHYEVTLDVAARKMRADSAGHETETPMDDFVEIGVFATGTGDGARAPLYLQRHRIHSGKQSIRINVPRAPGRAGIDPLQKLIDRDREDNVVEVKAAEAGEAQ